MFKRFRALIPNRSVNMHDWPDSCDHVRSGADVAAKYTEDDSFGPVIRSYYCEACALAVEEKADWLQCEWCGAREASVGTKRSSDSSDYYCICSACDRKQWADVEDLEVGDHG